MCPCVHLSSCRSTLPAPPPSLPKLATTRMLKFKGSQQFRQRLVYSTLSSRPIQISDIRASDQHPGLRDFEAGLLRLIEKITNGCTVEINETGAASCSPVGPHGLNSVSGYVHQQAHTPVRLRGTSGHSFIFSSCICTSAAQLYVHTQSCS